MRVHAVFAALMLAALPAVAASGLTACGAIFARGELLPEEGARVRVARTFALHAVREPGRPRVGVLYRSPSGGFSYQAEPGSPRAAVRAIEMRFLRAAGFDDRQAHQYTDLTFLPVVVPIRGAIGLARRFGLTLSPCAS